MTVPEKIKDFLKSVVNLSLGTSQINFFNVESLEEEQIRYRFDTKGKPLILKDDDWYNECLNIEWLVIGCDQTGDPIIVEISEPELPVLIGAHIKEGWEASYITYSLENFNKIISLLRIVSTKRTTPDELKENPISNE